VARNRINIIPLPDNGESHPPPEGDSRWNDLCTSPELAGSFTREPSARRSRLKPLPHTASTRPWPEMPGGNHIIPGRAGYTVLQSSQSVKGDSRRGKAKVTKEFSQMEWNQSVQDDCRQLVRLAIREDLERRFDITTLSLVDRNMGGRTTIAAREGGVICGLLAAQLALDEMDVSAEWTSHVADGDTGSAGTPLATLSGRARDLLTVERLLLNLIGRLSGVATLTRQYVDQVAGIKAKIYDTRKTTPGWRRLEKFAVRCGGGRNHRTGLFDAVLIKDNHLALVAKQGTHASSPADAVSLGRQRLLEMFPEGGEQMIVEIEVDTLAQLENVLPQKPDIVLLDNMSHAQLRSAVSLRDTTQPATELEASGGVNLSTVADIARTGVDRISVGALTHSAVSLDVAMDWAP